MYVIIIGSDVKNALFLSFFLPVCMCLPSGVMPRETEREAVYCCAERMEVEGELGAFSMKLFWL